MIFRTISMAWLLVLVSLTASNAQTDIAESKALQWMVGANSSGLMMPKRAWNAFSGREYNLKNLERRRFLQYERQGAGRGINLGWTDNASASTASKRAKWFFARQSDAQSPITYGERLAIGWGDRQKPFIRYAKRLPGINLDWSRQPVYEWVFLGGEAGEPVRLGEDRVAIFNMKHREPLIYFNRTVGAHIGWPDSTTWNGPLDEIIAGLKWTGRELKSELDRMVLVCKLNPECQLKIKLYQAYMIQLRTNVTHYKLPPSYQTLLGRFYPELDTLKGYRFGYSTRQPDGNATTDCSRTYYSDKGYVDRLRSGRLFPGEFSLLLHELQHYNQCRRVGGRNRYAKMWFQDLEVSAIQAAIQGRVTSMKALHDGMPMEKEAKSVEIDLCKRIQECKLN